MDSGVRRVAMKPLRWSLGLLLLVPAVSLPVRAQQTAAPSSAMSPAADATANTDAKPKKARVWDNDNIPKAGDEISVVGPAQAAPASADANAGANGATAGTNAPAAG